jgi:hypothetical protein
MAGGPFGGSGTSGLVVVLPLAFPRIAPGAAALPAGG